ncbi:hypothetical protein ACJX0J_008072, partial [Zea mays]
RRPALVKRGRTSCILHQQALTTLLITHSDRGLGEVTPLPVVKKELGLGAIAYHHINIISAFWHWGGKYGPGGGGGGDDDLASEISLLKTEIAELYAHLFCTNVYIYQIAQFFEFTYILYSIKCFSNTTTTYNVRYGKECPTIAINWLVSLSLCRKIYKIRFSEMMHNNFISVKGTCHPCLYSWLLYPLIPNIRNVDKARLTLDNEYKKIFIMQYKYIYDLVNHHWIYNGNIEESIAMENKIQDLQAQLKVRFIQKNYLFYLTTGATKMSICLKSDPVSCLFAELKFCIQLSDGIAVVYTRIGTGRRYSRKS